MQGGDGARVSMKPADSSVMSASSTIFEGGGHRSISTDYGVTFDNVTLGLDQDTSSVIQIDPTPGLKHPLLFTHSQLPTTGLSRVFYKPLDKTTGWKSVSSALFAPISQLDHTTEPALHEFVVTLTGSRNLFVLTDVRAHLGNLVLFENTPPLPKLSNGVSDAHANAGKSSLEPQTLYYVTAGSRPSRAFRS